MPVSHINGIDMYYKVYGDTGDPVIMLPGAAMPGIAWRPYQVPALLEEGFRPIIADGRGVGRTESTQHPYTIDLLTDDFIALIDFLDLGPVHVVGLSQGTFIAENLAVRRPDLLLSAVFMGGVGETTAMGRIWAQSWRDLLKFGTKLPDSMFIADDLGQGLPGPMIRDDDETVRSWENMISSREGLATPGMLGQYIASNDWILDRDHANQWERITTKSLIVAFEHDLRWPPRTGRAASEVIPDAEFKMLIGAGHTNAIFDHHEELNDVLIDFLDRNRSRTTQPLRANNSH